MTLAQDGTALLKFFESKYRLSVGRPSGMNQAKTKWAARDLIESYGLEQSKQAIEWYFKVSRRLDWTHFVSIADQCVKEMHLAEIDSDKRRRNRTIANEWRNRS
jgi:hypothetical protein